MASTINVPDGSKLVIQTTEAAFTIEFAGSIIRLSSDQELNLKASPVSTDGPTYVGGILNVTDVVEASAGITVGTIKVIGSQQPSIANATTPADAVGKLNALLEALRAHGLIAT